MQVNHIDVTSDRDPLDLCKRLLHNASNLVTLLIRRPVIVSKQNSNVSSSGGATHQTLPSRIIQMPVRNDSQIQKSSTIDRFQLVWSLQFTKFCINFLCVYTLQVIYSYCMGRYLVSYLFK